MTGKPLPPEGSLARSYPEGVRGGPSRLKAGVPGGVVIDRRDVSRARSRRLKSAVATSRRYHHAYWLRVVFMTELARSRWPAAADPTQREYASRGHCW